MSGKNKAIMLLLVSALLLSGCGRAVSEQSSEITEASGASDISYESEASESAEISNITETSETSEETDLSEAVEESEESDISDVGEESDVSNVGEESDVSDEVKYWITYEYNEKRKPLIEFQRDSWDNLRRRIDYVYNEEYDSLEYKIVTEYNVDGVITLKEIKKRDYILARYEYDDNGNEIKFTSYTFATAKRRYFLVKEYDEDGLLKGIIEYGYAAVKKSHREFGKDGRAVKETFFNPDGSVDSYVEFSEWGENGEVLKSVLYTESGEKVGHVEYIYHEDDNPKRDGLLRYEYTYDLDGLKSREREFYYSEFGILDRFYDTRYSKSGNKTFVIFDSIDYKSEYEYDEINGTVVSRDYNPSDTLTNYSITEYRDDGTMKSSVSYYPNGVIKGTVEYTERGFPTKITYYKENGEYNGGYEYVFVDGYLKKEMWISPSGTPYWTVEYKYEDIDGYGGNLRYDSDGKLVHKIVNERDENQNMKMEHHYDYDENEVLRYEFHIDMQHGEMEVEDMRYDENGNMISHRVRDENFKWIEIYSPIEEGGGDEE